MVVSRASYMCRKCKAHGQAVPVKRHKRACPYLQCRCLKCRLVDQGRKVVARQIALYRDQKGHSVTLGGADGGNQSRLAKDDSRQRVTPLRSSTATNPLLQLPLPRVPPMLPVMPTSTSKTVSSSLIGRTVVGPHCRRCRNHNVAVTWKGHKKSCPYRNCPCDPCRLINVRKDTEKTLRDMAGIEEKSMLPTSILSEESTSVSNFFPYLMPVSTVRSTDEALHQQQQNHPSGGTEVSWNEPAQSQRTQRRTRSLQNLNAQLPVSETHVNNNSSTQGGNQTVVTNALDQNQPSPIGVARNQTAISDSPTHNFDQYHRGGGGGNYDVYYEEKLNPRPVLPFWQSFGHFEDKSTASGQSYIGNYYGLENGRVFHGHGQGHHMYSPERVSAVAAAAAAAAAMVAMTPPINGAYQQPCYASQGRAGGLCHPVAPQHADHLGYGGSEEFALSSTSSGTYQTRFPADRGRGEDCCGGWGAYRYPYMIRGLPFHTPDAMDVDASFGQRHLKSSAQAKLSEDVYSRPVAHVWRSQLHQLSISQLRTDGEEVKRFHQIDCNNKVECLGEVKGLRESRLDSLEGEYYWNSR
uniref:DM domain-containing protein n=1 Tax=Mesocestoides corti TaxID=53468 RepID=A0A5K3FHJ2_MESCO